MTEGFPSGKHAGAVLSEWFIPADCSPAVADTHRKQMDSVLVSVGHGHEGPRSGLQPSTMTRRLMDAAQGET